MGSIKSINLTSYNITTIKTKKDGSKVVKVENKPDDPQLARDPNITGSQKMLAFARAHARNNSQVNLCSDFDSLDKGRTLTRNAHHSSMADCNDYDDLRANKKTRYLSTIMDLSRVESIKTMETGEKDCKIFVETSGIKQGETGANNQSWPAKRKRRKITIISNKKHRDGSIETVRQDIYKNYGDNYARRYGRKLNKTLTDISPDR